MNYIIVPWIMLNLLIDLNFKMCSCNVYLIAYNLGTEEVRKYFKYILQSQALSKCNESKQNLLFLFFCSLVKNQFLDQRQNFTLMQNRVFLREVQLPIWHFSVQPRDHRCQAFGKKSLKDFVYQQTVQRCAHRG